MTIRILSGASNRETRNAELLRDVLVESEPRLDHPDITADILCNLSLPGREIDLVLLYHDARDESLQFKTPKGTPIHSFVLIIEVKQHSSDLIRFEGPRVLVRYDKIWSDATHQCDDQTWALKRYQKATYKGRKRRQPTFIQRAIWLPRASASAFDGVPSDSSVPVHFSDLSWNTLTNGFVPNRSSVRTLVEDSDHPTHHSIDTLRTTLTHRVIPTRLDLKRVNALTKTRFDTEKTAYIQNLGSGLLILRGRGGTGKTFALVQVALHLARQGKRTIILTYNHGLIADINRALYFIKEKNPTLDPLPELKTRYAFTQDVFKRTFGPTAEEAIKTIPDISEREKYRLAQLMERKNPIEHEYDFALIDEGQDWEEEQRDLVFRLFGPGHVVVADGVDQFVGQDRCNWDRGDIPINRRHGLRASRRTKAATCQTVAEIAHELGLSDWDLEPDPDTHGGRFTVLVEPDARRAVDRGLKILEDDQRRESTIHAVDSLICVPSAKMAKGTNFAALFDNAIELHTRDSWRGFEEEDRRIYPIRKGQLRAIQYNSCRGMEGWTTLCLGLDAFFDFQLRNPRIDIKGLEESFRAKEGMFWKSKLDEKLGQEAHLFAVNWLMIPLTRSIDHLVVHIADEDSKLCEILRRVSQRFPGSIEWINPRQPVRQCTRSSDWEAS